MFGFLKRLLFGSEATVNKNYAVPEHKEEPKAKNKKSSILNNPDFIAFKESRLLLIESKGSLMGNLEAICPNCSAPLPKFPSRKVKCKSCQNPIYPRLHPLLDDEKKRLFTEKEEALFPEFQAYLTSSDVFDTFLINAFKRWEVKQQLAATYQTDPEKIPESDVNWKIYNDRYTSAIGDGDFYIARDTRVQMIIQLLNEGKTNNVKELAFETIYLAYTIEGSTPKEFLNGSLEDNIFYNTREIHFPELNFYYRAGLTLPEIKEGLEKFCEQTQYDKIFKISPKQAYEEFKKDYQGFLSSIRKE